MSPRFAGSGAGTGGNTGVSANAPASREPRPPQAVVPRKQVLSYITGNIGMNLLYQSVAVYLLYFYTDVFGLTAAAAGSVLLIARIIDLVADPAIGVAIDRTRSRWGKFRPYLLFGPLPLGALAVLCFTAPGLGDGMKLLYATVVYSLFSIAYAVVNVAYASMLPALSRDYYQRGSISGYRELAGTVAILAVNAGTLLFVHQFGTEKVGFPVVMAIYALVTVFTLIVVFAGTKGIGDGSPESSPSASPHPSLRAQMKTLSGNRPLFRVLAFNFASTLAAGIHLSAMVFFFKYNLGRDDLFPLFQLVSTLAMFAAMAAVPALIRMTGKRSATITAQVITILGLAGLFFLPHQIAWVFVLGSVASAGFGITRSIIWGVIPDTVEYGEWKSGHRAEGIVYAAFIGMEKLGSAVSGIITGLVLSLAGFVANTTQTSGAEFGVLLLITAVPIVATLAVIGVMKNYRLDGRNFEQIVADLRSRPQRL
ncbi:glycoside-pentoside-hexuronide (GPH):cation symporter [Nonomuraea sp. NPDC046802]|uniref:glycoside-pentoside-hexuronide (GPH):cation symporter n=1 Tax=Nonomuraea sp. NPDC046802 TaxID=3154919 RepID=UPI0033D94CD6